MSLVLVDSGAAVMVWGWLLPLITLFVAVILLFVQRARRRRSLDDEANRNQAVIEAIREHHASQEQSKQEPVKEDTSTDTSEARD